MGKVEKGRNWTAEETEGFCEILADLAFKFAEMLETKALPVFLLIRYYHNYIHSLSVWGCIFLLFVVISQCWVTRHTFCILFHF